MRGHSNLHIDEIKRHENKEIDAAMIPIEGGASLHTVRPLPPLALRKEEWRKIGDRMDWWKSTNSGGTLWVEFHDRGGRVAVQDLTLDGLHNAMFQCTQMLEELETAREALDAAEEAEEATTL